MLHRSRHHFPDANSFTFRMDISHGIMEVPEEVANELSRSAITGLVGIRPAKLRPFLERSIAGPMLSKHTAAMALTKSLSIKIRPTLR